MGCLTLGNIFHPYKIIIMRKCHHYYDGPIAGHKEHANLKQRFLSEVLLARLVRTGGDILITRVGMHSEDVPLGSNAIPVFVAAQFY